MNTFTLYDETIKINDEIENWFLAHLKMEKEHKEKIKEVEQKLMECTPLSLDGKDVRLFKKIAAQIHLSATDQIKVVVSETIDSFKKDYKWLDLKLNTNKDLLYIYKHVYDEELIHKHIENVISSIHKQDNPLLDDLYRNGFAPTYLIHFYNSIIQDNIEEFEKNHISYSFYKNIKPIQNPSKEDILQAIQTCPFNVEIYKQASTTLYTTDLKAIQNHYHVRFIGVEKPIMDVDPIMQKKQDEVMKKMGNIASDVKKDTFGKDLLKKYPNKSNKEVAHSYLKDCGITWENGLLTFVLFCNILSLFMMEPPKKARHSTSDELYDMLTDILTDIIVLSLVEAISSETTNVSEPIPVIMDPLPTVIHTTRKSPSTKKRTHTSYAPPIHRKRRMSLLQFILSLFMKDEWKEKYDKDNWYGGVNPYDYHSEKEYLEALRNAWKEDQDPDGEFEEYVDVNDYEDWFDYECDIEQYQEKKAWQEKYNPKEDDDEYSFDINVYEFELEDEYLETLRNAWKQALDPDDKFSDYVDVADYDNFQWYKEEIDYLIEEKEEWKQKYDPNDSFRVNPCDYEDEEEYLEALQMAWQDFYNPNNDFDLPVKSYKSEEEYIDDLRWEWKRHLDFCNEFEKYVDVKDYENYEDYKDEIDIYQNKKEWQSKYDPNNDFQIEPYECQSEEEYLEWMQESWKEELDPYNTFSVDVSNYQDFDSYNEAIKKAKPN